jgi:hypothetical protein
MKAICLISLILLAACQSERTAAPPPAPVPSETARPAPKPAETMTPPPKTYSNARFKDVTVEKTGEHQYLVRGKGQIFEASFSWVVEDGHNELKKGFEMTDAGAPEWGNFSFTVEVEKERENSTLHLILFESSPKDGSRQYELPVFLE